MEVTFIGRIHEHNNKALSKNSKYLWLTLIDAEEKYKMGNIIKLFNQGNAKYSFSYYKDYPNMKLKINIPKKKNEYNIYKYSSIDLIKLSFLDWYKHDIKITAKVNKHTFKKYNINETEISNVIFLSLIKIEVMKY